MLSQTQAVNIHTIPTQYLASSAQTVRRLQTLPHVVWLDSGKPEATSTASRMDIISAAPSSWVSGSQADLVEQMQRQLDAHQVDSSLPFTGGWIGYFGYEFLHSHFNIKASATPAWFGWYDWAIIHDHDLQRSQLVFTDQCSPDTKDRVLHLLGDDQVTSPTPTELSARSEFQCSEFEPSQSRCAYIDSIERILDYIAAGDCYQVNFAQKYSARFEGDILQAYETLRATVPSPYGAFLSLPNETILSVSPEQFIKINKRHATTHPIKGSAPRGATTHEDEVLKKQLQNSAKDRAENVMIVDLLRNDFSQMCQPHSVKVPNLFDVHTFKNVHHLVSTIEGELTPSASHVAFLLSCFPGGSITGAPKERAMQIIDELEPDARGPYCGSIGYLSSNQKTEFNIAIRTLHHTDSHIHCWGGGGIVTDSNPDSEYEESQYKVACLMAALTDPNT